MCFLRTIVKSQPHKKIFDDHKIFCRNYRQTQIFALLCDQCFQMELWPIIEFICGVCLIMSLYVMMICHDRIPSAGMGGLCILTVTLSLICCHMFNMASLSTLKSVRIVRNAKYNNESKYVRKFLRSCAPIVYWIGEFHKIDRGRCLSFIRFVTYRTFALVFKTKLSKDFGSNIVVYLPVSHGMI